MVDDEPVSLPLVALFLGIFVTLVSLLATGLLASDGALSAVTNTNSPTVRNVALRGLLFFLALAPFLAVAMWTSFHGVTVTLFGDDPIQPVPLFGAVDGALEPLVPVLLVLAGLFVAGEVAESPLGRAVGGTVAGVATYVVAGWVLALGSALFFNVVMGAFHEFLVSSMPPTSVTVGLPTGPFIRYGDPVGVAIQLASFSAPLVALGAVLTGAGTFLFADDADRESTDRSLAPSEEPGPGPGDGQTAVPGSTDVDESTDGNAARVPDDQETAGADAAEGTDEAATGDDTSDGAQSDEDDARTNPDSSVHPGDDGGADGDEGRWRDDWYEEDERRQGD
jgi:hypothetical protein